MSHFVEGSARPMDPLEYMRAEVRDGHDVALTNADAAMILALIDELSRRVAA
jgi:hypothetical protein